jgi:formylglycine-generating enzyme required for sulfatase activity
MMRTVFITATVLSVFITGLTGYAAETQPMDEMLLIPAGDFLMGSSPEEIRVVKEKYGKRDLYINYPFEAELPKRKVYLASFYIDRHEVTNKEYVKFIKATGYKTPHNWDNDMYESGMDDHPVLFVSQTDAAEYAKWAGKRLPTEQEWEKAARGSLGLVFPWGNEFDPYKAVTAESDLTLILGPLCNVFSANGVELAEGDISPYGVRDMAGNVREWTATVVPGDDMPMAVIKGGSWVDVSVNARAAHREYVPQSSTSHIIGFRCAKDVSS